MARHAVEEGADSGSACVQRANDRHAADGQYERGLCARQLLCADGPTVANSRAHWVLRERVELLC